MRYKRVRGSHCRKSLQAPERATLRDGYLGVHPGHTTGRNSKTLRQMLNAFDDLYNQLTAFLPLPDDNITVISLIKYDDIALFRFEFLSYF